MKRHWAILTPLSLGLITFVVYFQTLSYGLITLDDPEVIEHNPFVMSGLSLDNLIWAWTTTFNGIWHPLTWMTFQFESELFGAANHQARHTVNLLIHVINVLMVYAVARRLSEGNSFIAYFCALLFAIHPQHVQVVTWITERKELLATFFVLPSLLFFLKWQHESEKSAYLFSFIFYMFALMSKPSAMPMVMIFGLLIMIAHDFKFDAKKFVSLVPFVIAAVIASIFVINIKTTGNLFSIDLAAVKSDGAEVMSTSQWLGLIPLNLAHYLTTSLIPWPLPMFEHTPEHIGFLNLIFSLLLISLFMLVCIKFRHSRIVIIGLFWFLAFWLPVSGLISLGEIYVADRYMYLPHIGLFCIFSCLISQYWSIKLVKLLAVSYISVLLVLCFKQNQYWRDGQTLFEREIQINPRSYLAPIYVGWSWQERGDTDKAIHYYDMAINNQPDRYFGYMYKGILSQDIGDHETAIESYFQALSARDYLQGDYLDVVFVKLAWLLFQAQRYEEAEQIVKQSREHGFDSDYLHYLQGHIQSKLK